MSISEYQDAPGFTLVPRRDARKLMGDLSNATFQRRQADPGFPKVIKVNGRDFVLLGDIRNYTLDLGRAA